MSQLTAGYDNPVIQGMSAKVQQHIKTSEFEPPVGVAEALKHSVKFSLGESDDLPTTCDIDEDGNRSIPIHLPFDLMAIESISTEYEGKYFDSISLYKKISASCLHVFFFARQHGMNEWVFPLVWGAIEMVKGQPHQFRKHGPWPVETDEAKECYRKNAIDTCNIALTELSCLNTLIECNNIGVETVPAPKPEPGQKLGKRKRELLQFEYRVLTIKGRKTYDDKGDGSHRSPRLHLRRGHIRKFPSGKKTWISSCAVGTGKRGVIQKDYSVEVPS